MSSSTPASFLAMQVYAPVSSKCTLLMWTSLPFALITNGEKDERFGNFTTQNQILASIPTLFGSSNESCWYLVGWAVWTVWGWCPCHFSTRWVWGSGCLQHDNEGWQWRRVPWLGFLGTLGWLEELRSQKRPKRWIGFKIIHLSYLNQSFQRWEDFIKWDLYIGSKIYHTMC